MNRNLDGCYIRISRNGKWQNICLSDMTVDERHLVLSGKNESFLLGCIDHLSQCLKDIGNQFDIARE